MFVGAGGNVKRVSEGKCNDIWELIDFALNSFGRGKMLTKNCFYKIEIYVFQKE